MRALYVVKLPLQLPFLGTRLITKAYIWYLACIFGNFQHHNLPSSKSEGITNFLLSYCHIYLHLTNVSANHYIHYINLLQCKACTQVCTYIKFILRNKFRHAASLTLYHMLWQMSISDAGVMEHGISCHCVFFAGSQ